MARADAMGFFWNEAPAPKPPKKTKDRRPIPERTWERDDYLPNLDEALAFSADEFTDEELYRAAMARERLVFDIECYPNYFLVAFTSLKTGKVAFFERTIDDITLHGLNKLIWITNSFTLVGFNSYSYDIPILSLAVANKTTLQLHDATKGIIEYQLRPQDILKSHKVKRLKTNHIDVIEIAPLQASLKIYSGRIHAPRMQDLPFVPGTFLNAHQIAITRWYCVNDLTNTTLLYKYLEKEVTLREKMSVEYGVDVRSKSDAQVAEAVIGQEMRKLIGGYITAPELAPGTSYRYQIPAYLQYKSGIMNKVLDIIRDAEFQVDMFMGGIVMPASLDKLDIVIAGAKYRMGIGGLHSSEQNAHYTSDKNFVLIDRDVTSYYPKIILNQNLYPKHLGIPFLQVYQRIVDRRLHAKRTGDKVVADSLKITINGSFGKLGNKYSILYSPDLFMQVVITGQLSLLFLIERCEWVSLHVVSANTDGIVIRCPREREPELAAIVAQWEKDTNFETEETRYKGLYSRDVNNYIAIKEDGTYKTKGIFKEEDLSKNPTGWICVKAVIEYLLHKTPITATIRNETDVRNFVTVRQVRGGAVKDGIYLGKAIRWYYALNQTEPILTALTGNKVPKSDGAKPLMGLPDALPSDIDYEWYENEAISLLHDLDITY